MVEDQVGGRRDVDRGVGARERGVEIAAGRETSARATRHAIAVLRFWPASSSLAVAMRSASSTSPGFEECAREQRGGLPRIGADAERAEPFVRGAQRRDRGLGVVGDELDHAREQVGLEQAVA